MVTALIVVAAVAVIGSLVLAIVMTRRVGGLSLGSVFAEHPIRPDRFVEIDVPPVNGILVVALCLGYRYQRFESGSAPTATVDVRVDASGDVLVDGTFAPSGAGFNSSERWSGDDAWRRETRRLVDVSSATAGCTLRVRVNATRADQLDEVTLVLATR
ncbi:MAG: hypothetical protein AAFP84_18005 [Actinomycetota bacterium]